MGAGIKKIGRRPLGWILIILGLVGVIVGVGLYSNEPRPYQTAYEVSAEAAPVAVKPTSKEVDSYTVPPDNPKYIAIPAIAVSKTPVIKLGLLKSGAIATPDNIFKAGWYAQSAKPGQPGAMFVFGHVSSWQANGVFYDLKKLRSGDTVTITRGDNKTLTYTVVRSQIYPADHVDMHAVLAPVQPGKPGLNLMTCAGSVIRGTNEFSERLVVFTSLSS